MNAIMLLRIAKLVALVGFLLPWVLFSAFGQELGTMSGLDIAMGHFSNQAGSQQVRMNIFVLTAFALTATGLLVSFIAKERALRGAAIIAVLALAASFFGVVELKDAPRREAEQQTRSSQTLSADAPVGLDAIRSFAFSGADAQIAAMSRAAIRVREQTGYWLTLLALAGAAGIGFVAQSPNGLPRIPGMGSGGAWVPRSRDDVADWDRIADKDHVDSLQEYLLRHPHGRFAELARVKLERAGVAPLVSAAAPGQQTGADVAPVESPTDGVVMSAAVRGAVPALVLSLLVGLFATALVNITWQWTSVWSREIAAHSSPWWLWGLQLAVPIVAIGLARIADIWNRATLITLYSFLAGGAAIALGFVSEISTRLACSTAVLVAVAAAIPTIYSLVSDYFGEGRRALAMGFMRAVGFMGGLLISLVALLTVGGEASSADAYFPPQLSALGGSMVAVGLAFRFFVREPTRDDKDGDLPRTKVMRVLFAMPRSSHFLAALTLSGFLTGWLISVQSSALADMLSPDERSTGFMLISLTVAVSSAAGIVIGAWIAEQLARTDARWYAWVPAALAVVGSISLALSFNGSVATTSLALFGLGLGCAVAGAGPAFAVFYGSLPSRLRATAGAVVLFTLALPSALGIGQLGYGVLATLLSDPSTVSWTLDFPTSVGFSYPSGGHSLTSAGGLPVKIELTYETTEQFEIAIQRAKTCISLLLLWPALHYLLAARSRPS